MLLLFLFFFSGVIIIFGSIYGASKMNEALAFMMVLVSSIGITLLSASAEEKGRWETLDEVYCEPLDMELRQHNNQGVWCHGPTDAQYIPFPQGSETASDAE